MSGDQHRLSVALRTRRGLARAVRTAFPSGLDPESISTMDDEAVLLTELEDLLSIAVASNDTTLRKARILWEQEDEWTRRLAWRHIGRALKTTRRASLMDEFRRRVMRWTNELPSIGTGGPTSSGFAAIGGSITFEAIELRAAVAPALLDFAAAVIVGDRLAKAERALLQRPFAFRAFEEPPRASARETKLSR